MIGSGRSGKAGGGARRAGLALQLAGQVRSGSTLAGAMESVPDKVPPAHAALIAAGERAGATERALARVVEEIDRRAELRQELWRRAAYPLACLVAAVVLLPLPIAVLGHWGFYALLQACILGPLVAAALILWKGARWFPKGSGTRVAWERFILRSRFLGGFASDAAVGRSFVLLGDLYEAGLPLADSIPLAARAAAWDQLEADLLAVEPRLRHGDTLAEAMEDSVLLARDLTWIARIEIGEQAGSAGRALRELGRHIEDNAHRRALQVVKIVPIVIFLIVGGLVLAAGIKTIRFPLLKAM